MKSLLVVIYLLNNCNFYKNTKNGVLLILVSQHILYEVILKVWFQDLERSWKRIFRFI